MHQPCGEQATAATTEIYLWILGHAGVGSEGHSKLAAQKMRLLFILAHGYSFSLVLSPLGAVLSSITSVVQFVQHHLHLPWTVNDMSFQAGKRFLGPEDAR